MRDVSVDKPHPLAPDARCQGRQCDGVLWPATPAKIARPMLDDETDEEYAARLTTAPNDHFSF